MATTTSTSSYETIRTKTEAAILAVLEHGQAIAHDGRVVTRADLEKLQATLDWANARIAQSGRGGIRTRRGTPKWRR